MLVNPEEALVIVCSVMDIKGLVRVQNHLDLEEFYIKSTEAFSVSEKHEEQ